MDNSKSGFSIGDKFVYASKYGGITFGIVEKIMSIKSLELNGVTIVRYIINKHYDSKEIHHYTSVMDEGEYKKLLRTFDIAQSHKQ